MSRPLLAVVASFVALAAAHAADPVSPIAPVPAFSWTGFYLGGSLGAVAGRSRYSYEEPGFDASGTLAATGLSAGLFAGSTLRVADRFVLGAESDSDVGTLSPTKQIVGGWLRARAPLEGSLRVRAGFLVNERTLAYATGGLAQIYARTDGADSQTVVPQFSLVGRHAGYTLGGGIDHALDAHWFARAELRHTWVDPWTVMSGAYQGIGYELRRDHTETSLRLGLGYMAGDTATVVRNY